MAHETLPLGLAVLYAGHTGIGLFFVLSAFLITQPFWSEVLGGARVDLSDFVRRRVSRILPVYVVAVTLSAALVSGDAVSALQRALPYLVFIPTAFIPPQYQLPPVASGVWWSLSTEVQFYGFMLVLTLVGRSRAGVWGVGAALMMVFVGYAALMLGHWPPNVTMSMCIALLHSMVGRAPLFACGALAAFVFVRHGRQCRTWMARTPLLLHGRTDVLLAVLVGGLLGSLAWLHRAESMFELEARWPLWHVGEGIVWAVVVLGVVLAPLRWRRMLAARPLVWVGRISYSVYLVHMAILSIGMIILREILPWTRGWDAIALVGIFALVLVTWGVASLSFVCIERPMMRLGRRRPAVVATNDDGVVAPPAVRSAA